MKLRSFLLVSLSLILTSTIAQGPPAIEWQKALGGYNDDYAHSVVGTSDGGFVIGGRTESNDGDVSANNGSSDFWIVKIDTAGSLIWENTLGGWAPDVARSIQETSDGGYVMAGYTASNDADVSGNHGSYDFWVVKLDSAGGIVWQNALGGSGGDFAQSIQETSSGDFVVAGWTGSSDGDVSGYHASNDYWVVKLDASGAMVWQSALGGSSSDVAYCIKETNGSEFVVVGHTFSHDWDVSGNHGLEDFWLVKLDSLGDLLWQQTLGGTNSDKAHSVVYTSDGAYVIAGGTRSIDGDVSGYHGGTGSDFWVVKVDSLGVLLWQKALGGSSHDIAYSVEQTSDGGYIVVGRTESNDGDVTGNHGGVDLWMVKLDSLGDLLWQKTLGGSLNDIAYSVELTSTGGYLVVGSTGSNDGNVYGNHGGTDLWVVKLDSTGSTGAHDYFGVAPSVRSLSVFPNPSSGVFQLSLESGLIKYVLITDAVGREVLLRKGVHTNSVSIDLTDQPQGAYLATVRTADGSTSNKVVIKR